MRDFIKQGRREELFIVSKVWNDEHQPDKVRWAPSSARLHILTWASGLACPRAAFLLRFPEQVLACQLCEP